MIVTQSVRSTKQAGRLAAALFTAAQVALVLGVFWAFTTHLV